MYMMSGFTAVTIFATVLTGSCIAGVVKVSVMHNETTDKYSIVNGVQDKAAGWAVFDNTVNKTGWAQLEVHTNGNVPDNVQAYAAGLAEGYITKQLMSWHWKNTIGNFCAPPYSAYCKRLKKYLQTNLNWISKQVQTYGKTDPYWHQVELFLIQLNGLEDGYGNATKGPRYEVDYIFGVLLFQIGGDLEDLQSALKAPSSELLISSGRCSALIKLLPGNKDLLVAQDTWNEYESMLRILKKYDFAFQYSPNLNSGVIPGSQMTFSSYPGTLYSGDDFYLISSSLAVQETSLGNNNPSLWKYVNATGTVLEVIRNMVANRLASSGREWAQIFQKFNSGTYNNQWMIVDYNKFSPVDGYVWPGLLVVLEQMPGKIVWADQTELLVKQTYWPSYNSPFYPEIFNMSGTWDMVKKYGDWYTYDKTPRALIFKRNNTLVNDMDTMTKLMRYNNYQHDPLSRCNCTPPYSAENAIAARSDLNPINGTYPFGALGHRPHGATDMKLTNFTMAKKLQFVAIAGPTHDPLPPFQWSKSDYDKKKSHLGHPDLFKFDPIVVKWVD